MYDLSAAADVLGGDEFEMMEVGIWFDINVIVIFIMVFRSSLLVGMWLVTETWFEWWFYEKLDMDALRSLEVHLSTAREVGIFVCGCVW